MPDEFVTDRDLADEGEEAAVIPHAAPWRPTDGFYCNHAFTMPVLGTTSTASLVECVHCRRRFALPFPWTLVGSS